MISGASDALRKPSGAPPSWPQPAPSSVSTARPAGIQELRVAMARILPGQDGRHQYQSGAGRQREWSEVKGRRPVGSSPVPPVLVLPGRDPEALAESQWSILLPAPVTDGRSVSRPEGLAAPGVPHVGVQRRPRPARDRHLWAVPDLGTASDCVMSPRSVIRNCAPNGDVSYSRLSQKAEADHRTAHQRGQLLPSSLVCVCAATVVSYLSTERATPNVPTLGGSMTRSYVPVNETRL